MNEFLANIENLIILYAPVVMVYVTQFVDWFVTLRTFKRLDVKNQVQPVLTSVKSCTTEITRLDEQFKAFNKDKASLSQSVADLSACVASQNAEIVELKDYLKKLVHENIELKATLRREFKCAVKEPESV